MRKEDLSVPPLSEEELGGLIAAAQTPGQPAEFALELDCLSSSGTFIATYVLQMLHAMNEGEVPLETTTVSAAIQPHSDVVSELFDNLPRITHVIEFYELALILSECNLCGELVTELLAALGAKDKLAMLERESGMLGTIMRSLATCEVTEDHLPAAGAILSQSGEFSASDKKGIVVFIAACLGATIPDA